MAVPVLHVCDKFGVRGSSIHGVSRLFSWWFPRYDLSRFTPLLCGLKQPEPASDWLGQQGIPVHHLGRGRFDPRVATDLVALVRQRGARILHVHGYAAADFGRIAARATGARLVLHEHFADPAMPFYQALADRLLSRYTDGAIAVSGSTRDFLVRERAVPAEKVRVIWNGAPLEEFAPVPKQRAFQARAALGIPADALVFGTIGRLSTQKGHVHLLDAAARVLPSRKDARLLLVGDGDLASALRAQAATLGIAGQTIFAGHRTDVRELLGALDVFCISSLYEGTPLALFEAMAAGKPIVSTAVDGCREVLVEGESGLMVPPADPTALAGALERVLADPALRASLASGAREASRRYDVAACVAAMQAFYDDLLAKGAA